MIRHLSKEDTKIINKHMRRNSTSNAIMLCYAELLSHVWLFWTLWTVACQAPLSMGFSRQAYWSRLPCPPPGIFLTQGSNPHLQYLLYWQQVLYHYHQMGSPNVIRELQIKTTIIYYFATIRMTKSQKYWIL